jgi:hypothetical protein
MTDALEKRHVLKLALTGTAAGVFSAAMLGATGLRAIAAVRLLGPERVPVA